MQTEKYFAYLIQRCKDGFVVREFQADRTYRKESLPNSKLYCQEIRRTIYDRELKPRSYYWGMYKQRNMRWISCSPCSYDWHGAENGRVYGKTLPHLEKHELRCTGLVQWIRKQKSIDPESYLAVWRRLPQMEQIWKSGLSKLTKECFKNCDVVRQMILYPEAPRLIRALGLDSQGFNRLRQMDGDTEDLGWLQVEKKRGKPITNELLRWFRIHKIRAKDILFIVDRMSPLQIRNYLQKQKKYFDGSCRQALITWQDYMAMAQRLHIDTSDEIIYRVRKLRQRHDELVIQCEAGSLELQAEKMAEKYPNVDGICRELQKKYTYAEEEYMVVAPENIFAIIKEGRMLHHCVGNDGSGERYYERMERRESFILFLRRTDEPEDPYYTLEIEPDGTVRQKRTLFDRQHEDSGSSAFQNGRNPPTPPESPPHAKCGRCFLRRAEAHPAQQTVDVAENHSKRSVSFLSSFGLTSNLFENVDVRVFHICNGGSSITNVQQHIMDFSQQPFNAPHRNLLGAGNLTDAIAALFQMNNIHLLLGHSAGQLVEKKVHFQLLHDWVMGRNGIF